MVVTEREQDKWALPTFRRSKKLKPNAASRTEEAYYLALRQPVSEDSEERRDVSWRMRQ